MFEIIITYDFIIIVIIRYFYRFFFFVLVFFFSLREQRFRARFHS